MVGYYKLSIVIHDDKVDLRPMRMTRIGVNNNFSNKHKGDFIKWQTKEFSN